MQKTAYEVRISDWSSDVCASDLATDGFRCALPILRKLGFRKHRAHPRAQRRQHLALEPRVGLEPGDVARARVWQRQHGRHVLAPAADRVGEARLASLAEEISLRVLEIGRAPV